MSQEATFRKLATLCLPLFVWLVSAPSSAGSYAQAQAQLASRFPAVRFIESPDLAHARVVSGIVSAPVMPQKREQAVLAFAFRHGAVIGFDSSTMSLRLVRRAHQRVGELLVFEQHIAGLPVYDAKLLVRFDKQGRLAQLSSALLSAKGVCAAPTLSQSQAVELASAGYAPNAPSYAELGILPVQGHPVLVYMVIASQKGPRLTKSFIDAHSGAVLFRYDAIKRHRAVVYEHNPVVDGQALTEVELPGIVADGEHALHTYGEFARVASCDDLSMTSYEISCPSITHRAVATQENGFLDIQPVLDEDVFDDGFAEIMVYYTVDRINRWYRDTLGFDHRFFDSEQFKETGELQENDFLWIYPNANYANGFFAPGMDYPGYKRPDLIVLGSIYGKDLAYDNDVVSHEFAHAVSSKAFSVGMGDLDSLGINLSSNAVEEGSADYFSSTFQGDPNVGEYVGVDRVLENANSCPNDLIGEGHHDGQIVSGAIWNIRSVIGATKADNLYYLALSSHQIRTFDDLVSAIKAETYYLGKETDESIRLTPSDVVVITDELVARQLEGCKRLVPLVEGMEPLLQYTGFAIADKGSPSGVQYVVQTGPDTEALSLHLLPMGEADYDVLVRAEVPVAYKWSTGGYDYSWEATYDMSWTYDGHNPIVEAKISRATALPLQKETTYYFSIVCRPNMNSAQAPGCRNMLTVELSEVPEPSTDDVPSTDTQLEDTESTTSDTSDSAEEETDSESDKDKSSSFEAGGGGCDCRFAGSFSRAQLCLLELLTYLF
ncbi:MAG: hypothetical protein MUC50_06075 [Myxococcota bacterium]|jgi:hypothetical protein|nr:hypothetical protein [Myxococcota bacterium]